MKRLFCLIALAGFVSGCAKPMIIGNDTQTRVFTPCTNDNLCFRDSYNIAWDYTCLTNVSDYPVSYRSKQFEYQSNRVEYILKQKSDMVEDERNGGVQ